MSLRIRLADLRDVELPQRSQWERIQLNNTETNKAEGPKTCAARLIISKSKLFGAG